MIVLAAVAFGAAVTAPIPAATATTPSPAELVARNRAAAGRERDGAERESWSVHSSGLSGTLAVIRQGADSSATMLLGPFRTQHGSVHGQRWHQNDNGETVVERPEPSQTERPLSESVERVREPSEAWAVTSTFASGHVKRTYYDARSYLVVRSERRPAAAPSARPTTTSNPMLAAACAPHTISAATTAPAATSTTV